MLLSLEMTEVMIINNALFGKVEFFNPFLHLLLYNDFKPTLVRFHAGKKKFMLLIYFSEREFAKYMCIYNNLEY